MANLKNTTINDVGFLRVPVGTTTDRPIAPSAGDIRYNTTTNKFEVYDGSTWTNLGTTT
jgi:hypothetical protein